MSAAYNGLDLIGKAKEDPVYQMNVKMIEEMIEEKNREIEILKIQVKDLVSKKNEELTKAMDRLYDAGTL